MNMILYIFDHIRIHVCLKWYWRSFGHNSDEINTNIKWMTMPVVNIRGVLCIRNTDIGICICSPCCAGSVAWGVLAQLCISISSHIAHRTHFTHGMLVVRGAAARWSRRHWRGGVEIGQHQADAPSRRQRRLLLPGPKLCGTFMCNHRHIRTHTRMHACTHVCVCVFGDGVAFLGQMFSITLFPVGPPTSIPRVEKNSFDRIGTK